MNIIVTSIGNITAAWAASLATIPLTANIFYIIAIALLVAVFLLGLILGLFINRKKRGSKAATKLPPIITEAPRQSTTEDNQANNEPLQEHDSEQRRYDPRNRYRYYW